MAFIQFKVSVGPPGIHVHGHSSGPRLACKSVAFSSGNQSFTAFFFRVLSRVLKFSLVEGTTVFYDFDDIFVTVFKKRS